MKFVTSSSALSRASHLLPRLAATALLLAASFGQFPTAAQTAPAALPAQPGYYRLKVGAVNVTVLADGTLPQPLHELLANTTPAEIDQLLAHANVPYPVETSVNAYLLDLGTRLVLIDAGGGDFAGPLLGHLVPALRAAGYQPEQVTDILLTHFHADHVAGLMTGSQRTFANATLHYSKPEADYWLSEANLATAPVGLKKNFGAAQAAIRPYVAAGKAQPFTTGGPLFAGVQAITSYGHTRGHAFYALESQGQKLVFWGDMMTAPPVQLQKPAITSVYDTDPKQAAAVRLRAYADAAQQGYWVAVAHVSFPGVGHLRPNGSGYDWLPINYSSNGVGQ